MASQLDSVSSTAIADVVRSIFEKRVSDGHAPASCFAVFGAEGIEFEGAFGQRQLDATVPDATTVFRIASCTKSFTAATVLILRDRGQVDLDSPITAFVPEFISTSYSSEAVVPTVRMLLTMSAGLPTDDPWGDRQESMTRAELVAYLSAGVPLVSLPGTTFEYSNLGYALLGQVIEAVTGRAYIEVVTDELLEPLGLNSTSFTAGDEARAELARGYRRGEEGWIALPFSGPGTFSPMAGIFTTSHDLATWARWLASALDPAQTLPGPLSGSSRREMQQIQRSIAIDPGAQVRLGSEHGYGFGLFVDKDPIWGTTIYHSGGYPGFSTHMRWNAAAEVGIVAFENATYSGAKAPATEALDVIVQNLGRKAASPPPWPETLALKEAAELLIMEWDDDIANRIFAPNVALDIPFDERARTVARALTSVGGVLHGSASRSSDAAGDSPAHLVWHLPGERGRLRCEIRLAPTVPATIQTFIVEPE